MGVIQRTIDRFHKCNHVWSLNGNNGEFAIWKCDNCDEFHTSKDNQKDIK
jgi:ribosomal protein L37AE/L43A